MPTSSDTTHPERFDPRDSAGRLIEAEHRARYLLASRLVRDARVLDAGCGTGYGSRMLADAGAAHVVGVDVSDDAVALAAGQLGDRGETVRGDVSSLPFEDDAFDVVVCFEVIEHVEDRESALDEFARVLRPEGTLVISSPNRLVYPPGNPHHVYEYTPSELEQALRSRFPAVTLLGQHARLGSVVTEYAENPEEGTETDGRFLLLDDGKPSAEIYTVALAGATAVPTPGAVGALVDDFEVRWWQERVEAVEAEAREDAAEVRRVLAEARYVGEQRQIELEELRAALLRLETVDAENLELRGRLEAMDVVLDERTRELQLARDQVAERQALVTRLERVVDGMKDSASWRVTTPLRGSKRLLGRGRH